MSSNFEFLREVKDFSPIHKAAVVAEVNHQVDPASCCLLCRRAAELAFLWLIKKQPDFEKEVFLKDEYDGRNDFNGYIMRSGFGESTKNRLHCIRKKGNDAAHSFDVRFSKDDAKDALEDLHYFMSNVYIQRLDGRMQPAKFNADLIPGKKTTSMKLPSVSIQKNTFNELMTAVQFSESLGLISKDVREKIEKRVIHLRKTKKLDETASLMNEAANENIYVVNVDFKYQMVVFCDGTVCVLLFAGERLSAQQIARTIKCNVNHETDTLQVYHEAIPGSKNIHPENDVYVKNEKEPVPENTYLFRKFDTDDLLRLGVPGEYLTKILDLQSIEAFMELKEQLPLETVFSLFCVLNGETVEKAYKSTYSTNKKVLHHRIEEVIKAPHIGTAVIRDEDEIKRMFDEPLEKWKIYLHPQQRNIAYRNYTGPVRVLGGAGTGKSVVALHHAKYLAESTFNCRKIFFTTFTKSLTSDIEQRLKSICSQSDMKKIEVMNFDKLLKNLLAECSPEKRIVYDSKELDYIWQSAIQNSISLDQSVFPVSFYRDEWIHVIQAQDIRTCQQYVDADRTGRGKRVDRDMRSQIWKVFRAYAQHMSQHNILDQEQAANYCSQQLFGALKHRRFDSIIIDESPDFGPAQFRMLRLLAGEGHEDDLFITGDPRQRIYSNRPKVVLSRCGINVRGGRSMSLNVNYRTTGRILEWANRLLKDINYDDLDGGHDDSGATFSTVEGEMPEIRVYDSKTAEIAGIVSSIKRQVTQGVPVNEIAVVSRVRNPLEQIKRALQNEGILSAFSGEKISTSRKVHLLTMHESKGLEYSYVYVMGVDKGTMPLQIALNKTTTVEEYEEKNNEEKQLLYVSLTRARKNVYLSSGGEPSEFIALLE